MIKNILKKQPQLRSWRLGGKIGLTARRLISLIKISRCLLRSTTFICISLTTQSIQEKKNNGFNGTFKGQRSENNINLNYAVLGLSSTMGLCSSQMQHTSSRHPTDTHITHSSPPTFANICASAANLLPLRQALVGATPGGRDPTEERVEILRPSARQAKQKPFISFAIVSVWDATT